VRIFTVGHGARPFEALVGTLASGPVTLVIDVRSFPASRRHPQFGREVLEAALPGAGVAYAWEPRVGGRRRLGAGPSPNPAWRVEAFRAYADYMDTDEFRAGFGAVLALAAQHPDRAAVMCAETHPSRCHRRLLADKLWSLGHEVIHLIEPGRSELHQPPPFLRVDGDHLRYDVGVTGTLV
jgi:uncharacterized protein (DUF488 family)